MLWSPLQSWRPTLDVLGLMCCLFSGSGGVCLFWFGGPLGGQDGKSEYA